MYLIIIIDFIQYSINNKNTNNLKESIYKITEICNIQYIL